MGLFSFSKPSGETEVRMVVGLGNPGDRYVATRHNMGFDVVDLLGERLGVKVKRSKFGGKLGETTVGGKKLILLKPWEFMNRSGQAVATAVGYYRLGLGDLLVVTDDMALEPGRIRLRPKGSAGGHNGLSDIIARLKSSDFARLRVGIGRSEFGDSVDFVLARPSGSERTAIDDAIQRAVEAVLCWAADGIDTAMNRFNAADGGDKPSGSS